MIPGTIALFSKPMKKYLADDVLTEDNKDLARLLRSIHDSTRHNPAVYIMTKAKEPYRFCVISASDETREYGREPAPLRLNKKFYTDLPSKEERAIIDKLFRGEKPVVPKGQAGVFLDTRSPGCWDVLRIDEKIIGILILED